jgi:hypothetical protein
MKQEFDGIQVVDDDEHFDCLQDLFPDIDQEELDRIFQVWAEPVRKVSQGKRDCIQWQIAFIEVTPRGGSTPVPKQSSRKINELAFTSRIAMTFVSSNLNKSVHLVLEDALQSGP